MLNVDQKESAQKALREFGIPVVAGAAAAGAGILWRRKPDIRKAVPDVKGGVGDLVEDLRGKLESAIGKGDGGGSRDNDGSSAERRQQDPLTEGRRARQQRRTERRNKSGE